MAAPSTVQVFNFVRDQTGAAIANATVRCVLSYSQATVTSTGDSIAPSQQTATTDSTGKYTFTVVPTDLLSPTNLVYTIMEPNRSYDIAPQSGNGASQQTTAANVIVNQPGALAAATSNVTGPLTVAGLLTAQAGITVTGGITQTDAASVLIPGATSWAVRDNANANNNLLVTNAGAATVRNGLTVSAGGVTVTAGGATVTAGGLTVTAGGLVVSASGATITGGITLTDAASQIVPGATSLSLRNHANNADNLIVTDAGNATVRGTLTVTGGFGATTFSGLITAQAGISVTGHYISAGPAPSLGALQTGIANQSISGSDSRGVVTITTGTGPAAGQPVAVVNFGSAYGATPVVVVSNQNGGIIDFGCYLVGATGFTIVCHDALANSSNYTIGYLVIG